RRRTDGLDSPCRTRSYLRGGNGLVVPCGRRFVEITVACKHSGDGGGLDSAERLELPRVGATPRLSKDGATWSLYGRSYDSQPFVVTVKSPSVTLGALRSLSTPLVWPNPSRCGIGLLGRPVSECGRFRQGRRLPGRHRRGARCVLEGRSQAENGAAPPGVLPKELLTARSLE